MEIRMDGQDMPFLMASYVRKGDRLPSIRPEGQIATGVMVASNQPLREQLQSYGSAMPAPVALAGRTPSGPAPVSAAPQAFQAFDQVAVLPQIGPVPAERPSGYGVSRPTATVAAAYVTEPQAKAPQVMFGNVVLESARPAQKPVR